MATPGAFAHLFTTPASPVDYDAMMAPQYAWKHLLAAAYRDFIQGTVHDEIHFWDASQDQEPRGFSLDER